VFFTVKRRCIVDRLPLHARKELSIGPMFIGRDR